MGPYPGGRRPRGLRGWNDIVWAASHSNVGAVRHLLLTEPGAAAATDIHGTTALHGAALEGHTKICRMLLAAGVEARTQSGLLAKDCGAGRRCRRGPFLLDLVVLVVSERVVWLRLWWFW